MHGPREAQITIQWHLLKIKKGQKANQNNRLIVNLDWQAKSQTQINNAWYEIEGY